MGKRENKTVTVTEKVRGATGTEGLRNMLRKNRERDEMGR